MVVRRSRVATTEHHYYHMDEVWHALYNRAERRHLLDPEVRTRRTENLRALHAY